MQFRTVVGYPCVPGQLWYVAEDHAFDFKSEKLPDAFTTLLVNDVQIAVDDEGRALYVWGYCPLFRFQLIECSPPRAVQGQLVAILNRELIPGVSVRLNLDLWPVSINLEDGWVCLGDPCVQADDATVEFAQFCLAVVRNGTLASLWLRPQKLPDRVLASAKGT